MEAKQRVLECTFRNIKQLRSELSYITKEAESRQNHIHGFLSAFIPEFKNQRIADLGSKDSRKNSLSSESEDSENSRFKAREKSLIETKKEIENDFNSRCGDRSKQFQHSTPPAAGDFSANKATENNNTKDFDNNLFARTLPPNTKVDNEKSLPLPKVEYNWKKRESRTHKIPTYLPRLGITMISFILWFSAIFIEIRSSLNYTETHAYNFRIFNVLAILSFDIDFTIWNKW